MFGNIEEVCGEHYGNTAEHKTRILRGSYENIKRVY